jgi:hypothetical protein
MDRCAARSARQRPTIGLPTPVAERGSSLPRISELRASRQTGDGSDLTFRGRAFDRLEADAAQHRQGRVAPKARITGRTFT